MKGFYVAQVDEKTWNVRHRYPKDFGNGYESDLKVVDNVKFIGTILECKAYIDLMVAGFFDKPEWPYANHNLSQ